MPKPAISIVMPMLNAGSYLPERLRTIDAQTFSDWETIVIDGFSDDGSWETVGEVCYA